MIQRKEVGLFKRVQRNLLLLEKIICENPTEMKRNIQQTITSVQYVITRREGTYIFYVFMHV
jgi:hypothetical protein